jgi:methionine-rich copper-binding protein CopC
MPMRRHTECRRIGLHKVAITLRQGGWRRVARTVLRVLTAASVSVGFGVGVTVTEAATQAAPAAAHARVIGSSPEDHAHIDTMPGRVSLQLASKPATVEGDPLRVYGPTGERVDAGDVELVDRTSDGGPAELSVGLRPDVEMPTGEYHAVYRVISGDTHLVAGRIMIHYGEPDNAALLALGAAPEDPERLAPGWTADPLHWPKLVFAGGVALALVGFMAQRWRRSRRDRDFGVRVLSAGLVAGRRLD